MMSTTSDCVLLFGALRVVAQRGDIPIPTGQAQSLLAYLCLYPRQLHARERLADLFWPHLAPERGRRALSDTLYRLRSLLGAHWFYSDAEHISLAERTDLWVDVWAFEAPPPADVAALDAWLALYTAPLLAGMYDDWLVARRVALEERHHMLLDRRAALAHESGDFALALQLYQQLIAVAPLHEAAYRGAMQALARTERLHQALDLYEQLTTLLADEVDAPPAESTRQLADQLYAELERLRRSAPPAPTFLFVGRGQERSRLIHLLDKALAGHGAIAVLLGEAGIGRTTLMKNLQEAAAWRGLQVWWGGGREDLPPSPLAPLLAALAEALNPVRRQQIRRLVAPGWMDAVERLLAADFTAVAVTGHRQGPQRLEEVTQALAAVLGALQQIAPQLILLDDVQWADPAFWPVLDGLRDSLSRQRILLVLSGRRGELAAQAPAWELLQQWDRSGSATVLPLTGLDEETLAPLLHQRMSGPATPARIHAIWQASGGNPLLALGLAATDEAELVAIVRPSLALLALRRFARLSSAAQAALEAAACLGTSFRYLHWEAVWRCAGYPEEQLPLLAGELEREQQLLLAGDAYRFAHDTLRSAVYQQTDPLQRQRWHRHALAALEADHVADLPALFHHAHRAAVAAGTVRYGRQAGQQALAGFSFQSAGAYFSAALAALPALDAETGAERRRLEAELLIGRAQAHRVLGQRAAELADLQVLQTVADELADGRLQALYRYHRADYAWSIGELASALALAGEGHALAQTLDNLRLQAMFFEIMGRIEREMKEIDHARRHIEQMQQIYATLGDTWGEALALDLLGGLGWDRGDYQTAMTGHRAAAERFRSSGDILREAQSLNNLGSTYWALGDYAGARAVHTRSLAVCRQMGNRRGEADNVDNLGGVAWVLGDYDAAIHLYDAALRIRRAIDDQWGVAISLANLGSAYREQGAPAEALDYYAQAYPLYQAVGRRRGEGYVLHARGLALLELARTEEARDALLAALAVRREIGSRFATVESLAALALAHLATGELPAALAAQQSALAGLDPEHDSASLQQQVHWASYQVAQAVGEKARGLLHLARAEAAMQRVSVTLTPQECATFLENVPLNRQVVAAVAGETVTATVQLAASDAPVGRPVRSDEYCTVRWTVSQPGDLLIAEGAARRSHILLRLAREAEAQGGAPTDADLAAALGVSRRTILRDIAQLAEAGIPLRTRSRR